MKLLITCLIVILIQACSVGSYYVLSETGQLADNITLYEDETVAVTLVHFDGKSSAIHLSSITDQIILINAANVSVMTRGQALQQSHKHTAQSEIQLRDGNPHMVLFSYVTSSLPSPVVEEVMFSGSVNGKEINIAIKYDLATKSYGWFEATRGI